MADVFWSWICPHGHETTFVQMGISSSGEILARFYCLECDKEIVGRTTKETLLEKYHPNHPQTIENIVVCSKELTVEDESFLKELGVSTEPPTTTP